MGEPKTSWAEILWGYYTSVVYNSYFWIVVALFMFAMAWANLTRPLDSWYYYHSREVDAFTDVAVGVVCLALAYYHAIKDG